MIYNCEACQFTFERTDSADRCPDCGKECVREATLTEAKEYTDFRKEMAEIASLKRDS